MDNKIDKNHWMWDKFKAFTTMMCKGKDYFACALNYKLSMHHNLLSAKRVDQMKQEDDYDATTWLMEMDTLFFGESENAFFKLNEIQKCRSLIKPMIPPTTFEYLSNKKNKKFKVTKQEGEIRLLGCDIALMGGSANDNTIFTFMRLLPSGEEYIRHVSYIESMNGQHTSIQAIRLKQLFYDLDCDFVVMDTAGNGLSIFDECSKIIYDNDRDCEYPPWTCLNNDEMKDRAFDKNAIPLIYSIKVVKAEENHKMAMSLKNCFENKKIKLLVNEIEGKDHLIEKHDYMMKSIEEQGNLIKSYVQTTMLVNELVNLEAEIKSGLVKLKEIGRNRKDRYSSLSYTNYYASILEQDLKIKEDDCSLEDYIFF